MDMSNDAAQALIRETTEKELESLNQYIKTNGKPKSVVSSNDTTDPEVSDNDSESLSDDVYIPVKEHKRKKHTNHKNQMYTDNQNLWKKLAKKTNALSKAEERLHYMQLECNNVIVDNNKNKTALKTCLATNKQLKNEMRKMHIQLHMLYVVCFILLLNSSYFGYDIGFSVYNFCEAVIFFISGMVYYVTQKFLMNSKVTTYFSTCSFDGFFYNACGLL